MKTEIFIIFFSKFSFYFNFKFSWKKILRRSQWIDFQFSYEKKASLQSNFSQEKNKDFQQRGKK